LPLASARNYFRLPLIFETAPGPHDWLGRSVIVGSGEKHADHSLFNYFVVLECGLPPGMGIISGLFNIFY
jgi:hypothetical protein